jgi:4-hydroxy-3-polyprenylbenzoate decarboxylase
MHIMAFSGLQDFIKYLDSQNELQRVKPFVNPLLEITDIADRMVKSGGKALLFENTGTKFPLLINAFASEKRMAAAISRNTIEEAGEEIMTLFSSLGKERGILEKIAAAPHMLKLLHIVPLHSHRRGQCQEVVMGKPDLSMLPVLKCWPFDGGRFITLPLVHTRHPVTLKTNVGMYRMQVLGPDLTGMHWHRHKTGARHFEAWKETLGGKMPVTVTLGGDPVYTYAATAPMPENMDEYLLAGFLRKKRVRLVKCLTNDLWVPADSDFVIEGYVDTSEQPVWEGPFGDHTGFYSLADWYPAFHVTCITHRRNAVYPATIVGIPPMEDAWISKATEKIFIAPIKMAIAPEISDLHMPVEGVAHNLVIVRIEKKYPGQGMKVLNSLFGAGQMMFSKYIVVISGNVPLNDYRRVAEEIVRNADMQNDLMYLRGPLDVLDHSSDSYSFGGKMGIDATEKLPEELAGREVRPINPVDIMNSELESTFGSLQVFNILDYTIIVSSLKEENEKIEMHELINVMTSCCDRRGVIIIVMDKGTERQKPGSLLWLVLSNTDPGRDIFILPGGGILINGTSKINSVPVFPREWPNVVCSDKETIKNIDNHWDSYNIGEFIASPSRQVDSIVHPGGASVTQNI